MPSETLQRLYGLVQNRIRPIVIFILPVLGLTIWESVLAPPENVLSWLLLAASVIALPLLAWRPVPASLVLLCVSIATSLIPYVISTPAQLWTTLLALGCLGYYAALPWTLSALAVCIAMQALQTFATSLDITPASDFPFFAIIMMFAALAGYALRQNRNLAQYRLRSNDRKWQSRMLLQKAMIAEQIHDRVSNGLASIAREAQTQERLDGIGDDQRAAWDAVNRVALESASSLHRLMDELMDDGDPADRRAQRSGADFLDSIRTTFATEQGRLHASGIECEMRIAGEPDGEPPAQIRAEVMNLLAELWANMIKHCPAGTACELNLHCSPADITISERCTLPEAADDWRPVSGTGGYGLETRRHVIERLHGRLVWERRGREWFCCAVLPLD